MSDFGKLIGGFRVFKATTYNEQKDAIGHIIRQGAKPTTLFITCSDLRISPDTIFSSNPGDFYIVRNIASLVPPYDARGGNGVIAAIEYGVSFMNVENIVVLGHTNCEGIKKLMFDKKEENAESTGENTEKNASAIKEWLSIAEEAKDAVKNELHKHSEEEQEAACEHESILVSLKNLITYPFIEERIRDDRLKIYGWHFNIESGDLLSFNPETKFFEPIG